MRFTAESMAEVMSCPECGAEMEKYVMQTYPKLVVRWVCTRNPEHVIEIEEA